MGGWEVTVVMEEMVVGVGGRGGEEIRMYVDH